MVVMVVQALQQSVVLVLLVE